MRIFLDTSALVSFFLLDAHSTKAREVLEKILSGEFQGVISCLSLAELSGVMRRNTDEETAKKVSGKMAELIEKGFLIPIPLRIPDAYEASEIAISTGLKGADAIIVQGAKNTGAKLFTFDEKIRERATPYVEFFDF